MKLHSIYLENFRCYQQPAVIEFDDLTAFVGKNDIGKSTVLEALEIFFNNEVVKIGQGDANVYSGNKTISITCEFIDLPKEISLDAGAKTTLASEYLLTNSGTLKIRKVYDCSKKTPSSEIFIMALHPTAAGVSNLLELKEKELQDLIKARGLEGQIPLKGNPVMRGALWQNVEDLKLSELSIDVTKTKEDGKRIWEQLENYLPIYALFQSDRSSTDSDDEVQNPMKAAISTAIAEVQDEINKIQEKVKEKAEAIAKSTHAVLEKIDPALANQLSPKFIPPIASKWSGLFSISMDTDDGIPLNKRGSGVRRLILVSFFKAEAERRLKTGSKRSIIYAIEEPETAQHPNNQKILLDSFRTLSSDPSCQIILTTHSPGFVAELAADSIRFVTRDTNGFPLIQAGADVFGTVATVMGVVPDSRVKVFFCVEGPTDVRAFKALSRALSAVNQNIPDLTEDDRVAFVVLGGGNLRHWVSENYLERLGRKEFHIYDRDVQSYALDVEKVNQRNDGSWATLTSKYEIEHYLHKDAIKDAFEVDVNVTDMLDDAGRSLTKNFSEKYSVLKGYDGTMGDTKAKSILADKAFPLMNAVRIKERDPTGEVEGWFLKLNDMLQG